MTTPRDHEDQEFADFLQGRGELAQQLQNLAQPQPPEALTQAVMADAERALEKPQAANDAVIPDADRSAPSGWLPRMRMPLALAASIALGVVGALLWRDAPSPDALVVASTHADGTGAPSPTLPPHPGADGTFAQGKANPPMVIAQTAAPPITDDSVVMRSVPIPDHGADAAQDKPPQAWLATISTLLQQGKQRETLEAWDKFRKAHPDYPVPEVLQTQIDALKR